MAGTWPGGDRWLEVPARRRHRRQHHQLPTDLMRRDRLSRPTAAAASAGVTANVGRLIVTTTVSRLLDCDEPLMESGGDFKASPASVARLTRSTSTKKPSLKYEMLPRIIKRCTRPVDAKY